MYLCDSCTIFFEHFKLQNAIFERCQLDTMDKLQIHKFIFLWRVIWIKINFIFLRVFLHLLWIFSLLPIFRSTVKQFQWIFCLFFPNFKFQYAFSKRNLIKITVKKKAPINPHDRILKFSIFEELIFWNQFLRNSLP